MKDLSIFNEENLKKCKLLKTFELLMLAEGMENQAMEMLKEKEEKEECEE